ncbi:MAG: ATP-dependent Clp protease proteolytic subunit [Acidimicrobiaceae bacterium]|nr:ATP-dependent Clp protease proteolytic subunit [Acidimicrobiaceae bacterium]
MSSETQPSEPETPTQSPLFRAVESDRYGRQAGICKYEELTGRSLIVFYGKIDHSVIAPFADAVGEAQQEKPLDLMLTSPGGDAETAVRLARMCHAERQDFRVIVPDTAASAATLLALAAESVVMSNSSALGPIDPQVPMATRQAYIPAKDIVEIVDDLEKRTTNNPVAFELYAALLADVDAVIYQIAKAAIRRTRELVPEVLSLRQTPPSAEETDRIAEALQSHAMHSATIGYDQAKSLEIPAAYLSPQSPEWNALWRLHTFYVVLLGLRFVETLIEGRRVSFRFSPDAL